MNGLGIFEYGETEIRYLAGRDPVLGGAMEKIGAVERGVDPDLFSALVNSIVGQQISTKAQETIWRRMTDGLGAVTPGTIAGCPAERLQAFGITFKKAGFIKNAAEKVLCGELDIGALSGGSDEEICRALSSLNGVGVWTAEMLMIFSMQRPDILSYGDLAIHRGLRMLYRHRDIPRKLFEKYRRRYSPHASVASLYLWAVAGGALEGIGDPKPKAVKRK